MAIPEAATAAAAANIIFLLNTFPPDLCLTLVWQGV